MFVRILWGKGGGKGGGKETQRGGQEEAMGETKVFFTTTPGQSRRLPVVHALRVHHMSNISLVHSIPDCTFGFSDFPY